MPNTQGARSSVSTDRAYSFPRIAAALLFALVLLLVQYRHSPFIAKATSHQSPAYTELYFDNPAQLPSLAAANVPVPISFTIHNLEGHRVAYTYAVDFAPAGGRPSRLQQRTVTLANNQAAAVTNDVLTLPAFKGRAEISVSLAGRPETLHFWVESET